jgi:hypothetical protein
MSADYSYQPKEASPRRA